MDNGTFVFHLTQYDTEKLLPQISRALEKRTELLSRAQYPRLWKNIDSRNTAADGRVQNSRRTRWLSALCMAAGIFLFVPGLVRPQELLVPMLVGAIAVGAGIGGLVRAGKQKKNPFDISAARLLSADIVNEEVSFTDAGMTIPTDGGAAESIAYTAFERVIETADAYLLVYDTRVTALQKADLQVSTAETFHAFLAARVSAYHVLT